MKYFLYIFKLPFSEEKFCVGNNYMVGQSEKTSNKSSNTVEVLQDTLEQVETDGKVNFKIESKKLYHIDRSVPGFVKAIMPKACATFQEHCVTNWPYVESKIECPAAPGKYEVQIRMWTQPTGDDHSIPEPFQKHIPDPKKLSIHYFDLCKDIDTKECPELGKEVCFSYKLVTAQIQQFGIQSVSEATVGSKMKNQFFNNYKNLVQDYPKWKDFTMS